MQGAILNDLTRCVGCGACVVACKETNDLPGDVGGELDAYTWCSVTRSKGLYIKRQCMHCLEPTCASVCPVAALHKTEWGAVAYEADKCIGCRYCIQACPFDIPKYEWDSPLPKVGKCIMCSEKRLKQGLQPACTEVCPARATVFGQRDNLIRIARSRINSNPEKYVRQIYGLRSAGGTSVLYLSSVPFAQLGFRTEALEESYPELTWAIISKVPAVVGVGAVSLAGVSWVINRRMEMAKKRREEKADALLAGTLSDIEGRKED